MVGGVRGEGKPSPLTGFKIRSTEGSRDFGVFPGFVIDFAVFPAFVVDFAVFPTCVLEFAVLPGFLMDFAVFPTFVVDFAVFPEFVVESGLQLGLGLGLIWEIRQNLPQMQETRQNPSENDTCAWTPNKENSNYWIGKLII